MLGVPILNYVFYSTPKFKNTTMEILEDLGRNLGGSDWYKVQSSYMAKDGTPMTPALRFNGSVVVDEGDPCWSGRALGDTTGAAVIACLIKVGRLAYNSNSLTLLLTGPDVSQGSRSTAAFCAGYCGWHSTQVRVFFYRFFCFFFRFSAAGTTTAAAAATSNSDDVDGDSDEQQRRR